MLGKRLSVVVAIVVMLAMMLTSVGVASAAPCSGPCGETPSGGPNSVVFAHADAHALQALMNATERRGLK